MALVNKNTSNTIEMAGQVFNRQQVKVLVANTNGAGVYQTFFDQDGSFYKPPAQKKLIVMALRIDANNDAHNVKLLYGNTTSVQAGGNPPGTAFYPTLGNAGTNDFLFNHSYQKSGKSEWSLRFEVPSNKYVTCAILTAQANVTIIGVEVDA